MRSRKVRFNGRVYQYDPKEEKLRNIVKDGILEWHTVKSIRCEKNDWKNRRLRNSVIQEFDEMIGDEEFGREFNVVLSW